MRSDGVAIPDDEIVIFPEAEIIPSFAIVFMRMMFAHAAFEEEVHRLQSAITNNPKFDKRWNTSERPQRMATLIENHSGSVQDQEASEVSRVLTDAVDPCRQRNLLTHGRWWRFDPKTLTIKIRGERKGEPESANFAEAEILGIASKLRALATDLYMVRREIEHRRGDHDI